MKTVSKISNINKDKIILVVIFFIGVILRIIASFRGNNYDVGTFLQVALITSRGENIYTAMSPAPYGPVYYYLLGLFYKTISLFAGVDSSALILRYSETIFLTIVDIGIALILLNKVGKLAAVLFILNPISIIITGYHSQIDNFAIFIGLVAVACFPQSKKQEFGKKQIISLIILGISLAVKQVLLGFPFWLAVKQNTWKKRLLVFALPFTVFVLILTPFLISDYQSVISNILSYRSGNNAPFFFFLLPRVINTYISSYVIFAVSLVAFGLVLYKKPALISFFYYLGIMLIFSPSVAPQYFSIPIILISVFPNIFYYLFTLICTVDFLAFNVDELRFTHLQKYIPGIISSEITSYRGATDWAIALLFVGFIWMFCKKNFLRFAERHFRILIDPKKIQDNR